MKCWLFGLACVASTVSASTTEVWRTERFAANTAQDPTIAVAAATETISTQDGTKSVRIRTRGLDLWDDLDSGAFHFIPVLGNGEVCATVPPLVASGENAGIGAYAKAGVMFRLSTHAQAPMVAFLRETSGARCRARLFCRPAHGAAIIDAQTTDSAFPPDAPVHLRLERSGPFFTAYYRTNLQEKAWTRFAQVSVPEGAFADGILGGVALSPQSATATLACTFSDVVAEPVVQTAMSNETISVVWRPDVFCETGAFVRGFQVLRAESGSDVWLNLQPEEPLFADSFTDTNAVPGVEYRYRVDANILPSSAGPLLLVASQVAPVSGAEVALESADSIRLRSSSAEWSAGVAIAPPAGGESFDFSRAGSLAIDVQNLSTNRQLRLTLHVSGGGSDPASPVPAIREHRTLNTGIGLNPGETGTLRILLPHPDIYAAPDGAKGFYAIDTAHITAIDVKAQWPFEDAFRWLIDCRLSNLRLEGSPDYSRKIPDARYCPFVDAYGQFAHDDWPEKIHEDATFAADLAAESAALPAAPETWDEYGGWADGPQLTATGHFRTEKVDGKWYFVTPSGHLFFSTGIDVVRDVTDSPNGNAHPDWYASAIPSSGSMAFPAWNLTRKFGKSDYLLDYYDFVLRRLDAWGVNTIGNWSGRELMQQGRKPYVLSLLERDASLPGLTGVKFYDCFHADFTTKMNAAVQAAFGSNAAAAQSIDDPMCIGYFIDNELTFSGLLAAALKLDVSTSAAKRTFLDQAKATYGTVAALNSAWETTFPSLTAVDAMTNEPPGAAFAEDRNAFEEVWCERYFQACHDAIAAMAPDKLYLGSRFVGLRQSTRLWRAASKHCDVLSVNAYANSIFNMPATIANYSVPERPILIGEFHFGATTRGMFSGGLCPVYDQTERARSYTRFVQGALCHPLVIGCHWFQYRDQPLVGRTDGEAYQVGWVDVCDRPYGELTTAARAVGTSMYTYRQRGKLLNSMEGD